MNELEQQFTILNYSTIKYFLANTLHTQVPHHEISEVAGAEHLIFGLVSAFIYNLPFIILHSFPSSLIPAIECLLGLWGHHCYKKKQAKNYHEAIERIAPNIYDNIVDSNQLGSLAQNKNEAITSTTIKQLSNIPKHEVKSTEFSPISPANHTSSKTQPPVRSRRP